jgi:hypothetical protein
VDAVLTAELAADEEAAPGAGSGDGALEELGAGCGEGSGWGAAAAPAGTANAKRARQRAAITLLPDRARMDAAEARAMHVPEPRCRVRQVGRARIAPRVSPSCFSPCSRGSRYAFPQGRSTPIGKQRSGATRLAAGAPISLAPKRYRLSAASNSVWCSVDVSAAAPTVAGGPPLTHTATARW